MTYCKTQSTLPRTASSPKKDGISSCQEPRHSSLQVHQSIASFPVAQAYANASTELINRLDTIQVFNKLTHQSILSIVSLRLGDVQERLKERRMTLDVDDGAREWLARHGYSEEYGVSPIGCLICRPRSCNSSKHQRRPCDC